jgi:hypothetical protein
VKIQVAIIILEVAVIIGALAVFLIATILQLFKINAGLSVVLPLVGQIVAKTGPVNPVVDDINANLVVTRDALENLMLKKAGPDSAGLVESLFPGEGAKFLRRVGRSGKVVNVGTVYTRGVGILAGLGRGAPIGVAHAKGAAVRDPQYSTTEVAKLYPAPPKRRDPTQNIPKSPTIGKDPVHSPYEPAQTPGARTRDASGKRIETPPPAPPAAPKAPAPAPAASGGGGGGGGGGSAAPAPPPAESQLGRLSGKGLRPWER